MFSWRIGMTGVTDTYRIRPLIRANNGERPRGYDMAWLLRGRFVLSLRSMAMIVKLRCTRFLVSWNRSLRTRCLGQRPGRSNSFRLVFKPGVSERASMI
jgi:hypothetical protein